MQKIYTFRVSMMNGTVTMNTHVEACASRELAEQVKEAIVKANEHNDTLQGFRLYFSDVEELTLWESADEVPVLNPKPKTREQLEREREQCLHDLKAVRESMANEHVASLVMRWLRQMAESHELRLKEIEEELANIEKEDGE